MYATHYTTYRAEDPCGDPETQAIFIRNRKTDPDFAHTKKENPSQILDTTHLHDTNNTPITLISLGQKGTNPETGTPLIILPHVDDLRIATWTSCDDNSQIYNSARSEITHLLNLQHTTQDILKNPHLTPLIDTNIYTHDRYVHGQENETLQALTNTIDWKTALPNIIQTHITNTQSNSHALK